MDQLHTMRVFVRVAQLAGFAAASRDLGMSRASVTKSVADLEARLSIRLFDRTTRQVRLTEAGRLYLDRALECLQTVEDADASIRELTNEPRGLVRMTAPIDLGEDVFGVIADVMRDYPKIRVDLQLSNRVSDLVEEGFDVGVRVAPALDGRYIARPLARTRLVLCGAPEYLRRYGRPRRPEALAKHRNLVFAEPRPMNEVVFTRGRRKVRVKLDPVMTSNNGAALLAGLRRGVGLAVIPTWIASADFAKGTIEPLLLDWSLPEFGVFAVYPHRRFLSPKVRVLVEALRAAFRDEKDDPWWPKPTFRKLGN